MKHSDLKEKAEVSINIGKEIILSNIPNEEIVSIYIKGSYVRNELLPNSDVDLVLILKDEKYLPKAYTLWQDPKNPTEFPFTVAVYTIRELKTGIWEENRPKKTSPISTFVKHLDQLALVYGKKPEGELFTRTDIKDLTALLTAFKNTFIKEYFDGKFSFIDIVKQVIWLTEREQRALGFKPEYSWTKLAGHIKDQNHIIHDALKLRNQEQISETEKKVFIQKLDDYLKYLESKYL